MPEDPQPGTLEYAEQVAESRGDLEDAAVEDGMDPQPSVLHDADRNELAAICKDTFYAERDAGGTMHTAADNAALAILASDWLVAYVDRAVQGERRKWAEVTGDPSPDHARATNEDIAASLAELMAMRDAGDAAIQRVLDLCTRWDEMTKGEGPTTAQIRAAILGLDEGTNEGVAEERKGVSPAVIVARANRLVCPQTRFPDGTHCGEYGWHGIGCPEREEDQP